MKNTDSDYDDPAVEEKWCLERRAEVIEYLDREKVSHGEVGECPAWHVAPYVSIWAIESKKSPGWVGWWVICGDLPTDYISSKSIKHPREALRAFSRRWAKLSSLMSKGERDPSITVGSPENWQELAPLLKSRAEIFEEWSSDDSLWDE
jgi:hypothetical protein